MRAAKDAARAAALARRAAAHAARPVDVSGPLAEVLAAHRGRPLAGYLAIRTEIDAAPAMAQAAAHGPVCVPLLVGKARPLRFRAWTPGCDTAREPFGVLQPVAGDWIVPEVLIVPLLAFDRTGTRLGYGGGYYDRTLADLRRRGPVVAIGYGYAAQEAEALPRMPTDEPLDMIVTEAGPIDIW